MRPTLSQLAIFGFQFHHISTLNYDSQLVICPVNSAYTLSIDCWFNFETLADFDSTRMLREASATSQSSLFLFLWKVLIQSFHS